MSRGAWTHLLTFALLWLVVTAGVAFLVARIAVPDATSSSGGLDVPRIVSDQRATVSLTT